MKHGIKHNHLGRNINQAKALYRGLATSLVEKGRIETTLAKAKATVGMIDRLINLGKTNDVNSRRQIIKMMGNDRLLDQIFTLAPTMSGRNSGYTRIIKIGPRFSDTAKMVYFEFVDRVAPAAEPVKIEAKTVSTKESAKEVQKPMKKAVGKTKATKTVKKVAKKSSK